MADYVVTLTGKDNLSNTIKQVKGELNGVGASTTKIDAISQKFNKIQNSTAPLKRQFKDLKALMAEMEFKGIANTSQYTEIAKYAGKVKDALNDASMAANRFADDTFALSVAKDSITAVTGAATALTGTMALLGVNSEDTQKAILKVQSALSILNGVQAVANSFNKDSALLHAIKVVRLKAATAAQAQNTTAVNAGTIAQIKNNLAVLANPYVAAAAALAALAAAVVYYTSKANEMTDAEKGVKEALETTQKAHVSGLETYKKNEMELNQLRTTLDKFKGTKEQEKKLVEELNSKYGNSLGKYKDLDSWKKALANTSYYYCKVLQAEAKLAALNAEAYSAWAKAMGGEDVEKNMAKFKSLQEFANDALDDVLFYKDQLRIAQSLSGAIVSTGTKTSGGKTKHTTKSTTKNDAAKYAAGSIADLNAQLKVLQDRLNNENLPIAEQSQLLKQIAELQTRISTIKTGQNNIINGKLQEALKPKMVGIELEPKIPEDKLQKSLDNLMQRINKIHPHIDIDTNIGKMEKDLEHGGFLLEKFGDAASSLSSITDDEGIAVASIVAKAIGQIALGAATATAQAAELGPWAWIAFGATAMAEMMAMISSIHSATGYATGGIIGGTSYSGDKLVARVNSGEMVLNKRQQTNLFNAIASGNIGNGGEPSSLSFRIRGADLYGALKNYSALKSKSGISTGIV